MPAGYSGTPLLKKLGVKENMRVLLIGEPDNYFDLIESDISSQLLKKNETPDFIHLFVKTEKDFIKEMKGVAKFCKANSGITIWVSWYKKSSNIPTDISEETIRQYALQRGLVDVKVCAVSELWSGLKLVVPVAMRRK